jgi:hypothetical protein
MSWRKLRYQITGQAIGYRNQRKWAFLFPDMRGRDRVSYFFECTSTRTVDAQFVRPVRARYDRARLGIKVIGSPCCPYAPGLSTSAIQA